MGTEQGLQPRYCDMKYGCAIFLVITMQNPWPGKEILILVMQFQAPTKFCREMSGRKLDITGFSAMAEDEDICLGSTTCGVGTVAQTVMQCQHSRQAML